MMVSHDDLQFQRKFPCAGNKPACFTMIKPEHLILGIEKGNTLFVDTLDDKPVCFREIIVYDDLPHVMHQTCDESLLIRNHVRLPRDERCGQGHAEAVFP